VPDWSIEHLAKHHGLSDFDCGKPLLTDWIKQYASQNERRNLSRTFVAVHPGERRVFGYYSFSSYSVQFASPPPAAFKNLPKAQPVPAALIGRLAVDKSVQGQGLGSVLLGSALRRALSLEGQLAIHSVVVHAIDEDARRFYLKQGFESFLDNPNHLFIPMKLIRKLEFHFD